MEVQEMNKVIAEFESFGYSLSIQDACVGKLKTYKKCIWKYQENTD